ncbi:MAG: MYXO-CTERM sorting domain-containing protein [Verrucomicrobiales bacterium]
MKKSLIVSLPCVLACVTPASAAVVNLTAVQTYDETSNANVVDASGTVLSAAAYTTLVASAFTAGTGGVVDFERAGGVTDDGDAGWNVSYNGGANTLNVVTGGGGTRSGISMDAVNAIGATPISGGEYYRLFNGPGTILNFDNVYLDSFGLTILARSSARSVTISGVYHDDTTFSVISNYSVGANTASPSSYLDSPSSGPDTFFGFQAEAGKAIKQITISGSEFMVMDDFAFVTSPIPEPSALVLSLLSLSALGRRRR